MIAADAAIRRGAKLPGTLLGCEDDCVRSIGKPRLKPSSSLPCGSNCIQPETRATGKGSWVLSRIWSSAVRRALECAPPLGPAQGRAGEAVATFSGTIAGRRRLPAVPDRPLIDPLYLRERANEFRACAARVHDEGSKRLMLNPAESYENLARRAEERSNAAEGA
jgi:hypothetical protein